jgi:hypothetical protein
MADISVPYKAVNGRYACLCHTKLSMAGIPVPYKVEWKTPVFLTALSMLINFNLRSLGKLRPFLNKSTANSVAIALIQSRLDYFNSCLWGLPQTQLQRLQRVQNAAVRVVSPTKKSDHITLVLNDLHWLPVQKRIEHKVLSLVFSCIKGCAPACLKELLQLHAPSRGLRSSSQSLLRVASVERHKKKTFGARSFECVGPQLWNRLPQDLRDCEAVGGFRRRLKTYLYSD